LIAESVNRKRQPVLYLRPEPKDVPVDVSANAYRSVREPVQLLKFESGINRAIRLQAAGKNSPALRA
jgi:hypothetical protein